MNIDAQVSWSQMDTLSYTAASKKSSFAPVINADTRLLLLGSLPGEASLTAAQYYAHPRNQFWRLLGEVLDIELLTLDYTTRLRTVLQHRVGLWDVVARAQRQGSLDSQLREVEINDFTCLTTLAPQLRAIGCNGGEAWRRAKRFGQGWIAQQGIPLCALPSSSPAFTLPYAEKRTIWLSLREYL